MLPSGLSRMTGNCHVRFLGGKGAARLPTYPTLKHTPMPAHQQSKPRAEVLGCRGVASTCTVSGFTRRLFAGPYLRDNVRICGLPFGRSAVTPLT